LAVRQHKADALPIFHCMLPWPLRQLSLLVVEPFANAEPAIAAVAMSIATLFNLIILCPKKSSCSKAAEFVRSVYHHTIR